MKPAGRPRKGPMVAKSQSMEIRMTPSEKDAFRRASEIAGLEVSAWVRERLRRAATRELEDAGEIAAFLYAKEA